MQVTANIPDELAAQVEARGLSAESFVQSLIDGAAYAAPKAFPAARPKLDLEEFFQKMAAFSDKIPQLPDEAFTRESFYQDHD